MHPNYENDNIRAYIRWVLLFLQKRYKKRRISKDFAYAERVALESPDLLEYCKELNPEFAQRYTERLEQEKIQDILIEQKAHEMRAEWANRSQSESQDRTQHNEILLMERAREQTIQQYVEEELKD